MLNQTIIVKSFLWTWDKVVDASMPAMQFEYHVQIADNAAFTSPIADSIVSATTLNYVTNLPLGSILYFRVRARNTVLIESFNWAETQGEVGTISGFDINSGEPSFYNTILLPVCGDNSVTAGDFVNIYSTLSTFTCVRPADASEIGKEAHGFVLETVNDPYLVTVYLPGNVNYKARQQDCGNAVPAIGGYTYLSDSDPGAYSMSAPTITGHFIQKLGLPIVVEE